MPLSISVTTYNRAAAYDWSITSPSDALLEFCVENNLTEIRSNRNDVMSIAVGVAGRTQEPSPEPQDANLTAQGNISALAAE